jgi:hypothetical protein
VATSVIARCCPTRPERGRDLVLGSIGVCRVRSGRRGWFECNSGGTVAAEALVGNVPDDHGAKWRDRFGGVEAGALPDPIRAGHQRVVDHAGAGQRELDRGTGQEWSVPDAAALRGRGRRSCGAGVSLDEHEVAIAFLDSGTHEVGGVDVAADVRPDHPVNPVWFN